jgi:hypothetical protein
MSSSSSSSSAKDDVHDLVSAFEYFRQRLQDSPDFGIVCSTQCAPRITQRLSSISQAGSPVGMPLPREFFQGQLIQAHRSQDSAAILSLFTELDKQILTNTN